MPISTIDLHAALIIVDLQKGLKAYPTIEPLDDIIARSAELAQAFRRHELPVVLVNVTGQAPGRTEQNRTLSDLPADFAEIVDELLAHPQDHRVTKRTWGAFTGTDLESYLRSKHVTQVIVVGVATSAGVESTARFAHELGFHVVFPVDAMTDVSQEAHTYSINRIFPRIGETGSTADIIALLETRRT